MPFDTERFQLQQLASARFESMSSSQWIDRCGRRLSQHVPDIAPDGVQALAQGLWLSHWFEDPEATADQAARTSPSERYATPPSKEPAGDEPVA
jgi:hypothetical protein